MGLLSWSRRCADSLPRQMSHEQVTKAGTSVKYAGPLRGGSMRQVRIRGVAQLAERRSPKPKVGGSRPSAPAKSVLVVSNGRAPGGQQLAHGVRQVVAWRFGT